MRSRNAARKANGFPASVRPANRDPSPEITRLDVDERSADPAVMRLAIAQVNPTVGDLAGNRRLVEEAAAKAVSERADLVVLPEMVLTGYPPMDLLERDGFVRDQLGELDALLPMSRSIPIVLGAVVPHQESGRTRLHNAAVLLADGERRAVRAKSLLPTYDVFDERRHFAPATRREPVTLQDGGTLLGLTVCEDAWVDRMGYQTNPVAELAGAGCTAIVNLSASPWHVSKPAERRQIIGDLARNNGVPICFVNQVGGNDELIFDGGSFTVDALGRVHTFCHAVPDRWHVMGVTQGAGLSLRWFKETFGVGDHPDSGGTAERDPYDLLCDEAAQAPVGSDGVMWAPYLMGERTPHLDPHARAALVGLSASHTRAHVTRAILEGVAFSLRDSLTIIEDLGVPVTRMRLGGGGARSRLWRQIQADVYGRTVEVLAAEEGAAYGAALLAGVG
ncbi:MAG: hypothetical protein IH827_07000, partial [Myxococcales bacterium]|nr:hypothetical protein [Myxococcales bacterium]